MSRQGKAHEVSCTDLACGKAVACPESTIIEAKGVGPVEIASNQSDFAELDALFDRAASGEARVTDGAPYLDTCFHSIARTVSTLADDYLVASRFAVVPVDVCDRRHAWPAAESAYLPPLIASDTCGITLISAWYWAGAAWRMSSTSES